jgi:hypothetical protein
VAHHFGPVGARFDLEYRRGRHLRPEGEEAADAEGEHRSRLAQLGQGRVSGM